jgi:hypothetical protein
MLKKTLRLALLLLISICFGEDILETSKQSRDVPRELNYQGYLTDTLGVPITDDLDMNFKIFDAVSSGNELWSETQTNVPIERGVFSVILGETTPIPDSVFTDFTNTWLELTLDGPQTLTPRTRITSVGYAYTSTYSDTAEYARNFTNDGDWTINGNILYPAADYGLAMRSGNMLYGDSAHTHVNFGVACTTGVDGQNYSYCTVGGGQLNSASGYAGTVGGGYDNKAVGYYAAVSGGVENCANTHFTTVCGGYADTVYARYGGILSGFSNLAGDNTDHDTAATVAGGWDNSATAKYSFVGGGRENTASNVYATIGGGRSNIATNDGATVSGGEHNEASGFHAIVAGGRYNTASGWRASIGGGEYNSASWGGATVAGGAYNSADSAYTFIGGGNENVVSGNYSAILGGYADTIAIGAQYSYLFGIGSKLTQDSTFMVDMPHIVFGNEATGYEFPIIDGSVDQLLVTDGSGQLSWSDGSSGNWSVTDSVLYTNNYWGIARGGANNVLYGDSALTHINLGVACTTGTAGQTYYYCTVGGGYRNSASSYYTTVGGGWNNDAAVNYATVSGGRQNTADDYYATVGGGNSNTADSSAATVAGGFQNAASGGYATIGGGHTNAASGYYATVGGGYTSIASGYSATVGGGYTSIASGSYATVSGGRNNTANDNYATVTGGRQNVADTSYATVSGGYADTASGYCATVGGGRLNIADASNATVGGGRNNTASGAGATVSGGNNNTAGAVYATVGGGYYNTADSAYATVGGGRNNTASDSFATVGGGGENDATDNYATVGGGYQNTADTVYTTVGGGNNNIASEIYSTVGGGKDNIASHRYATVCGGNTNIAAGHSSFATNSSTNAGHSYSAAFTTSHTTASSQVRAAAFSTGAMMFTMDHPKDPMNKILNQHAVGASEAMLMYSGSIVLDAHGRATVNLPDYFDDINKNPRIQLTGVGSSDVVFVAEDVKGNSFVIGGKLGMKVYWTVTAERTDIHAEIARIQTPVEQQKTGGLIGHSLDDDALIGIYDRLQKEKPGHFAFKTEEGRRVHEQTKQVVGK